MASAEFPPGGSGNPALDSHLQSLPQPSPDGSFSQEYEDKLAVILDQEEYEDHESITIAMEEAEGDTIQEEEAEGEPISRPPVGMSC